jgi:hypothetical protein
MLQGMHNNTLRTANPKYETMLRLGTPNTSRSRRDHTCTKLRRVRHVPLSLRKDKSLYQPLIGVEHWTAYSDATTDRCAQGDKNDVLR